MHPNITIIIPVYNAEKYLRQCLDSCISQTMQDIQVICVNDGSTDSSREILKGYADKDSRIEVIDKPNGGQSTARNAALPHVRGKYIMFVDSDDWIDLDCCEKVLTKAEQTGADITFFFYQREGKILWHDLHDSIPLLDKITVEDKIPLLHYTAVCGKLWLTRFFMERKITFPEGLVYEDNYVHWLGVTQASRISVVPKKFYHYRYVQNSTVNSINTNACDNIRVYQLIEKFLNESGYMQTYKEVFFKHKLESYYYVYQQLDANNRPLFLRSLRTYWSEKDRDFCCNPPPKLFKRSVRNFYLLLIDGGRLQKVQYHFLETMRLFEKFYLRPIVKSVRTWFGYRPNSMKLKNDTTANVIPMTPLEPDEVKCHDT